MRPGPGAVPWPARRSCLWNTDGPSQYAERVTDEHADIGSKDTAPEGTEPHRDRPALFDDPFAIKFLPEQLRSDDHYAIGIELVVFAAAASIYSKAFLEALAKRHADGLTDLVRARIRKNMTEVEIGLVGDAAATIVVTDDLPDEARLALLDLDVTADELRGKVLRWDSSASAWRPDPDES